MYEWIKRSVARRIALIAGLCTAALAASLWPLALRWFFLDEPPALRRRVLVLALASGLFLVLGVTTAVVLLVRRLLGVPLQSLSEAMRQAEQGNFLIRAADAPADEIGQLGRGFNALLRKITSQQVDIIDTGRELTMTRRELDLKHELEEKAAIIADQNRTLATQLRELELLYETSKTITSQLDLSRLLDTLCEQVGERLSFEECAILLLDETSGQLVVRATYGLADGDAIRGLAFDPGEGISGIVARTGESLLIPDTSKDERYLHYKGRHLADGSFLCVPLRFQDRLVGLFNVLRPRVDAFSAEEIRILTSLGHTAALAIVNAQMFARLSALSLTDELTGVPNRRCLQQRAEQELVRARRRREPVALLLAVLDDFARLNEAQGHRAGEALLREVARALRGAVRAVDTVARVAGEQFALLLPRVGRPEAIIVAEKLRAVLGAISLPSTAAPAGRVTATMGLAVFPDEAPDVAGLLAAADRALLASRRAHRGLDGDGADAA